MRKYPEPNTTVFGGVSTDSIKSQEAAITTPTIKTNRCISIVKAISARTGKSIVVVVRLALISFKIFTAATNTNINSKMGSPESPAIRLPIQTASPLTSKLLAKAIPPLKSKMIPQGISTASSQLLNCFLFFAADDKSNPPDNGNRTKGSSAVTAIGIASLIHQMAIQTVVAKTAFTSWERPIG
jgi:hypothetical protein